MLSILLVISTVVFGWRPEAPVAGKRKAATDERARLIGTRESLFAELVALERDARAARAPRRPRERRKQLVTRLEQVYRDLAALDEQRAA